MPRLRLQISNEQVIQLAERCVSFRKKNLISRAELAKLMGVTKPTLEKFENNTRVGLKTVREFLRVEATYRTPHRSGVIAEEGRDQKREREKSCQSVV